MAAAACCARVCGPDPWTPRHVVPSSHAHLECRQLRLQPLLQLLHGCGPHRHHLQQRLRRKKHTHTHPLPWFKRSALSQTTRRAWRWHSQLQDHSRHGETAGTCPCAAPHLDLLVLSLAPQRVHIAALIVRGALVSHSRLLQQHPARLTHRRLPGLRHGRARCVEQGNTTRCDEAASLPRCTYLCGCAIPRPKHNSFFALPQFTRSTPHNLAC